MLAHSEKNSSMISIYDLRVSGAGSRLQNERAAWGDCGEIERLDLDHYILLVFPGGAEGLAK